MIEGVVAAALHAAIVSALFGALLFAVVAALVRARTLDATARHALWTLAVCTTALMPLGSLAISATRAGVPSTGAAGIASRDVRANEPSAAPDGAGARRRTARVAQPDHSPVLRATLAGADGLWTPRPNRATAIGMLAVWVAGVLAGFTGLALSLIRVRGLKRRSRPLDPELAAELPWLTANAAREREIYLRLCDEIETPVAVGFRRPVILIPTELATHGGLAAIEGLIVHEHAHLRRHDDWTNLVQRVIERLFWFNPLMWMAGRRIALEREIAADDAVVEATGRPDEYAKSLWQLAREMRMPEHAVVAPGALFTRRQISIRIEALLERRPVLRQWRRIAAATVAFTAVGCTLAAAASAPAIELPAPLAATALALPAAAPSTPPVPARVERAPERVAEAPPASIDDSADRLAAAALHVSTQALAMARARLKATPRVVACTDCERVTPTVRGNITGGDLSGRDLRGVDWRGRTLEGVNLEGSDLRGARLDGTRFIGVNLGGARLDNASLTNAVMNDTNISGASVHGANTTGLRIAGASFAGMDLRQLDLRSVLADCRSCDLQGADLRSSDIHGVRLAGLNFAGADLRGTNLRDTVLDGSDLESADLRGADLRGASLVGAALAGAALNGADTRGANFAN